ncbi:MAG: penicillin acylase family protein [Deltaproteobacteria bacterium]|nr:penicillin acylase family protein [Deltaproteobacteria bacterium]
MHHRRRPSFLVAFAFTLAWPLLTVGRVCADPVTDLPIAQTLTFGQLSAPVDVVRDAKGIPHIYASTQNDAAFALGNIHARERMFQMDVFRRVPSGTVSELLGFPDFKTGPTLLQAQDPPFPGNISNVTQDLFFQSLGFRQAAIDSFNALSPAVQSLLQAYADGVNEYINRVNTTGNLPAEYVSLSISSIAPWSPIDSVAFGKLQAFQLSFDFEDGPTGDLADVTDALGVPTGTTAFAQDLARVQPAANAFTVPDASNAPIPLTSLAPAPATMLADAKAAAKSEVVTHDGVKDAARAAKSPAGTETAKAAIKDGNGRGRKLSKDQQRAIAAARKETVRQAREYIAKLMDQPVMREIRARGTVGSNQWAVDGSVTDTGNPIYANDPHLGLGSPATFYELHVNTKDRGGDMNVTGIGFAGAPGVVQGHNESIAWGSTTNPADVTDWFLEDMSTDASGTLFSHYQGNPEAVVQSPIQVKVNMENGNEAVGGLERNVIAFASSVPLSTVKGIFDATKLLANFVPPRRMVVTRHGAIFPQTLTIPHTSAPGNPFQANQVGSALTVKFTGTYATRELDTFYIWNTATDLATFKQGLQFFDFGSQNWGYADVAGNIAYFSSGEFPIREDLDAGTLHGGPPYLVRDGTTGNEWKALGGPQPADQAVPYEIVPFAGMPQIENPPAHWWVNANNDPIGNTADNDALNEALAGTGPYLSPGYDEFRAARITELIRSELNLIPTPPGTPAGDGVISMADMERMQADVNQMEGKRLAPYFVDAVDHAGLGGAPPELAGLLNPTILDARNRLAGWTYNAPAGFDTPGDPGAPTPQELVDSVATTIYNVAVGRLMDRTFDARLAAAGIGYRQGVTEGVRGLIRLLTRVPFTGVGASGLNFFDDTGVALSAEEERDIILVKSLQDALNLLAGAGFAPAFASSTNVDDYLWGKVHYVVFNSFIDGDMNGTLVPGGGAYSIPPQPAVGFPPGMPADGARFTVDVANYGLRPTSATSLAFGSGANRRSVVEMASGAISAKNVIPGGEDGVVGRPHYGDQVNLWLGNGYHDTYLYTADVVANAASRETYPSFPGCTEAGPGRCAPGGGSPTTDCATEFFVDAPLTEKALKQNSFVINDGGGSDFDGAANGTCVAHVMICLNNNDPRLQGSACFPNDVKRITIKSPKPDSKKAVDGKIGRDLSTLLRSLGPHNVLGSHINTIQYNTAITTQDRCVTAYVSIPIRNGRLTRQVIRLRTEDSNGKADVDSLKIACNP